MSRFYTALYDYPWVQNASDRFGLSSKFDNDFPSSLTGKVSGPYRNCVFKHLSDVVRLYTIILRLR